MAPHIRSHRAPCSCFVSVQLYHADIWPCPHSMRSKLYITVRCPSVCLSVRLCPVDLQQPRRPAGLLLSARLVGDINRRLRAPCCRRRRSAADAGSVICWELTEEAQRRLACAILLGNCAHTSLLCENNINTFYLLAYLPQVKTTL